MATPIPADDWAQPGPGLRFSQDSVLLAAFSPAVMPGRALDLGAGSGVVGLEALAQGRLQGLSELVFCELQGDLFREALEGNIRRAAGLLESPPRMRAVFGDWRELSPDALGGQFDFIASNPPYNEAGRGRRATGPRGPLREEGPGGTPGLLDACQRLLKPGGVVNLSFPQRRLSWLLGLSRQSGLQPILLRFPPMRGAPLALARLKLAPDLKGVFPTRS